MKICFFDFDHTITRKDSFFEFLLFSNGAIKTFLGGVLLSPYLLGLFLKILPNWKAKQRVFSFFFKGWRADEFNRISLQFAQEIIPSLVLPSALERIKWHQNQRHQVVLVSASLESYLSEWCRELKIDLIGTKVQVRGGIVTGLFAAPNCFGPEKVRRIRAQFNLDDYSFIYAYGDSGGDKEMLELANESHFRLFK